MQHIGNRIDEILFKRHMLKIDLAKKLEITPHHLNSILTNKSLSTISILSEISKILDVPSDYLLQDFDESFLIFAIDDYLQRIDKDCAGEPLNEILQMLDGEGNQNG